jgi:hypothetical protein
MTNVREAFDQFLRGLELTPSEQDKAARQQADLRERLRRQLAGVVRDVLVGSYARKTAIRPLNDIDVFIELDATQWAARRRAAPVLLLEDVQRSLRACYGATAPTTRIQGRSVNIEFTGTGIGYDIIPAFIVSSPGSGTIYEIPDRTRQTWIKTNPESHRQRCVDANARAGGMLNRLIKAAKYWNRGRATPAGDKPLSSFHLEAMAYHALPQAPQDERTGFLSVLRSLQQAVTQKCSDPAGLGPNLDATWTSAERQRAQAALADAVSGASRAIACERAGDHAQACQSWRALLGPQFAV